MASSLKELMGLSQGELIAMGSQYGLTFHTGMRKSDMAKQLQASAASGWMDVNKELMTGIQGGHEESNEGLMYEGSDLISDAAHVAQMISSAGFTETFHAAMNGPSHHVEAVYSYMQQLGVSPDDVWIHMPKANPNIPAGHFGQLNAYMRDTLSGHQDIMPEITGHYSGNIMDEYSTNKGGLQASYEYLAHMYVDKSQYNSHEQYKHDLQQVTSRLQSQMGSRFSEVAFSSAIGAHTSYTDSLPMLGDSSIVKGVKHPRQPLNVSGLPYGSFGHGINEEYSLSASLTGQPGYSDLSKTVFKDVAETAKSLAKVYSGGSDTGMNSRRHLTSERDMILDSASRYADVVDVRHGYENLKRDVGDEPRYSGATIKAILENANEYNEAETSSTFDPVARIRSVLSDTSEPSVAQVAGAFTTNLGPAYFSNPAYERREARRIADYDAAHANFRDVSDYGVGGNSSSGPQFHSAFEQGTPEWHAFRNQYDITGSTVGSYLGHNRYVNPIKEMSDKLGFAGERRQNADMARGHELEPIARQRVNQQFGFNIGEVGAITNPDYPRMMYSPDGLIGDDALWEHKAPRQFFDLNDHQDYQDQVQLGMLLSNRNRTLFSQTVGNETRSQWVERDPEWFERNQDKLMSTLGRMDAGRQFQMEHAHLATDELKAGVRQTMTGEGIWGFQTTRTGNDLYTAGRRGMSRFSAIAGTEDDPFISGGRSSYESARTESQFNDYQPNFTHYTPQYPATVEGTSGQSGTDMMAQSVKQGILAAQEENRQKRAGQPTHDEDADFDDLGNPRGWSRRRIDEAFGGGDGGRGGGGGGGRNTPDWMMGGNGANDLVRGLAGGSISSATGGVMSAMSRTPWGMAAAAAIGAVSIGNEVAENINDFIGQAEDAGLSNPNEYSAMNLGMQQLGLNESQANRLNATTHSAYNTLLNGDPSSAVRIVQGTRGLLTIGDIRSAEGDPVRLAAIARQRGRERGWSQQRIAGAMQMAGLDGMARAVNRSDYAQDAATATVQAGRESSYAEGIAANDVLQANRADLNVAQNALQGAVSYGAPVMQGATNAIIDARSGASSVASGARNVYDFIMGEESGGRDFGPNGELLNSGTGAKGRMQVTDSTMRNPGLPGLKGINPDTATPDERAQFGRDYYDALVRYYDGDSRKAQAAYTDGFGTVDSAVANKGSDWLSVMPQQAKSRVAKYDEWASKGMSAQEGAGGFTRNGVSYGQAPINVNVQVDAKVNNQVASARATVNGQTATQTINMDNGAMQRR